MVKNLLDAKRKGLELAGDDIRALIAAYTKGDVPDYQMAAFAMATCCRGMTDAETFALTDAMRLSGACLDWKQLDRPTADKHSTGGVGDKISLVCQPLAATCGVAVPSLTGRGLGHTGGTADKLDAIPGYVTGLSLADYRTVVEGCGCSLTVQTAEIAPADKKLYALRDVTGTVPSLPLIVASILSKKLAEGSDALVFDVKCGRGAFMETQDDARALARAMVSAAKAAGRRSVALVTDMNEPLGRAVGNAIEVQEAIDVLKGAADAPRDVVELSVELAAWMVHLAKGLDLDRAREKCRENLANGKAFAVFGDMVRLHGGDLEAFAKRWADVPSLELKIERGGFVAEIDARAVAQVALDLGAGRAKAEDVPDLSAGVTLLAKRGDAVRPGQPIARLQATERRDRLERAAVDLAGAFRFAAEAPAPIELVKETVE